MDLEQNHIWHGIPWEFRKIISFAIVDYKEDKYDFYIEHLKMDKDSFSAKAVFLVGSDLVLINFTHESIDIEKIKCDKIYRTHQKFDITDIDKGFTIDTKLKKFILYLVTGHEVILNYPTYGSSDNRKAFENLIAKF